MPTCSTCGNDYDRTFEVRIDEKTFVFDSFECAIHTLAPVCPHCNCRIIGHGVQVNEQVFCCAHCAKLGTGASLIDRL